MNVTLLCNEQEKTSTESSVSEVAPTESAPTSNGLPLTSILLDTPPVEPVTAPNVEVVTEDAVPSALTSTTSPIPISALVSSKEDSLEPIIVTDSPAEPPVEPSPAPAAAPVINNPKDFNAILISDDKMSEVEDVGPEWYMRKPVVAEAEPAISHSTTVKTFVIPIYDDAGPNLGPFTATTTDEVTFLQTLEVALGRFPMFFRDLQSKELRDCLQRSPIPQQNELVQCIDWSGTTDPKLKVTLPEPPLARRKRQPTETTGKKRQREEIDEKEFQQEERVKTKRETLSATLGQRIAARRTATPARFQEREVREEPRGSSGGRRQSSRIKDVPHYFIYDDYETDTDEELYRLLDEGNDERDRRRHQGEDDVYQPPGKGEDFDDDILPLDLRPKRERKRPRREPGEEDTRRKDRSKTLVQPESDEEPEPEPAPVITRKKEERRGRRRKSEPVREEKTSEIKLLVQDEPMPESSEKEEELILSNKNYEELEDVDIGSEDISGLYDEGIEHSDVEIIDGLPVFADTLESSKRWNERKRVRWQDSRSAPNSSSLSDAMRFKGISLLQQIVQAIKELGGQASGNDISKCIYAKHRKVFTSVDFKPLCFRVNSILSSKKYHYLFKKSKMSMFGNSKSRSTLWTLAGKASHPSGGSDSETEIDSSNSEAEEMFRHEGEEEIQEDRPLGCQVCYKDNDEDKILLCDSCDQEYHMFCLDPPITTVPRGMWYCNKCAPQVEAQRRKRNEANQNTENPMLQMVRFIDVEHLMEAITNLGGRASGVEIVQFIMGQGTIPPQGKTSLRYRVNALLSCKPEFEKARHFIENGNKVSIWKIRDDISQPMETDDYSPESSSKNIKKKRSDRREMDPDDKFVLGLLNIGEKSSDEDMSPSEEEQAPPPREKAPPKISEAPQRVRTKKAKGSAQTCEICGKAGNEKQTMLCDGCDREFHIYCLEPPLGAVPKEDWFCSECIAQQAEEFKRVQKENSKKRKNRPKPKDEPLPPPPKRNRTTKKPDEKSNLELVRHIIREMEKLDKACTGKEVASHVMDNPQLLGLSPKSAAMKVLALLSSKTFEKLFKRVPSSINGKSLWKLKPEALQLLEEAELEILESARPPPQVAPPPERIRTPTPPLVASPPQKPALLVKEIPVEPESNKEESDEQPAAASVQSPPSSPSSSSSDESGDDEENANDENTEKNEGDAEQGYVSGSADYSSDQKGASEQEYLSSPPSSFGGDGSGNESAKKSAKALQRRVGTRELEYITTKDISIHAPNSKMHQTLAKKRKKQEAELAKIRKKEAKEKEAILKAQEKEKSESEAAKVKSPAKEKKDKSKREKDSKKEKERSESPDSGRKRGRPHKKKHHSKKDRDDKEAQSSEEERGDQSS